MPSVRRVPEAQWSWWLNTPESSLYLPHLEQGVATFMLQLGGRRYVDQDLAGDEDTFLQWSQRDQYVHPVQVLFGDEGDELPNIYFMFHGGLYEVEREQVPFTGEEDELWDLERLRIRGEAEAAVREAHARVRTEVEPAAPPAADGEPGAPEPIADEVILEVWRRDGGRCVRCGASEDLALDHVIPLAMGGANVARNLQLLCEPCDRAKRANLP